MRSPSEREPDIELVAPPDADPSELRRVIEEAVAEVNRGLGPLLEEAGLPPLTAEILFGEEA